MEEGRDERRWRGERLGVGRGRGEKGGGRREGRGGCPLTSSPGLSWDCLLYFC